MKAAEVQSIIFHVGTAAHLFHLQHDTFQPHVSPDLPPAVLAGLGTASSTKRLPSESCKYFRDFQSECSLGGKMPL